MNNEQLDALAETLCRDRPTWIQAGSLGGDDSRFLLRSAFHSHVREVVEIGTASGYSTMLLCRALQLASDAGLIGSDFRVVSYDILEMFYGDRTKMVGDAAREQLSDKLLGHISFRNPATAADLSRFHALNSIKFLFLDADHRHPSPTIDLLRALPYLAPLATVVVHDINLPILHPSCPDWGVKLLFDGLQLPKSVASESYVSNIGSFVVPQDKAVLETQLQGILYAHEWQATVSDRDLQELGLIAQSRVRTKAIVHPISISKSEKPIIRFQVLYRNPAASEVRIVWGLQNFTRVPVNLPSETFLTEKGSHMNTPMKRVGDDFVFEFEVEENTRLDYAFTVTRTTAGENVELWKGANSSGDYYSTILTVADADEKVINAGPSGGGNESEEWSELRTSVGI